MSGGSMGYFYLKLQDVAAEIDANSTERRAFVAHLAKVAQALHDIEWVDSGDRAPCDENHAILKCIGNDAVLNQAVADHQAARLALRKKIKQTEDSIKAPAPTPEA